MEAVMLNRIVISSLISAVSVVAVLSARAQSGPTNELYQIISGRYTECCGIGGYVHYALPTADQAFIALTVDSQRKLAEMKFLGQDMRTLFRIPEDPPRSGFTFLFTDGMVFPDRIEFGQARQPSDPDQLYFRYLVSNTAYGLRINGTVITPCPGCSDWFAEFSHTDLLASAMPVVTIRVRNSEVELCWTSASHRTYQLQFRPTLTADAWTDLGDRR